MPRRVPNGVPTSGLTLRPFVGAMQTLWRRKASPAYQLTWLEFATRGGCWSFDTQSHSHWRKLTLIMVRMRLTYMVPNLEVRVWISSSESSSADWRDIRKGIAAVGSQETKASPIEIPRFAASQRVLEQSCCDKMQLSAYDQIVSLNSELLLNKLREPSQCSAEGASGGYTVYLASRCYRGRLLGCTLQDEVSRDLGRSRPSIIATIRSSSGSA
ncbi:hypothetical protein F5Y01DRAFT_186265 [Xylaria sp. FL0043]|nr:hypothetical protein F5Y01DRAFT_186265 [Xylaria sp. FL0043]